MIMFGVWRLAFGVWRLVAPLNPPEGWKLQAFYF